MVKVFAPDGFLEDLIIISGGHCSCMTELNKIEINEYPSFMNFKNIIKFLLFEVVSALRRRALLGCLHFESLCMRACFCACKGGAAGM